MLSNVTVSVPATSAGVVVITAGILGLESEVVETSEGRTVLDLSGKSEKVEKITRAPWVEVLSEIDSVPGEHEGFGLVNDLNDQRRINYGSLMQPEVR